MLLFCEDELPLLDPEEPLLPPDELLLPELDAELWLLPELEAPLLELDEPPPLLLGAEELGADELFELPEPLPELEGALELLLGPDELLELDEPLLELEELLEPEELLLLGPDELGGLLSELDELLDSELWLIGFSSAMLCPEAPCPSRPTGTTLTALIVLRRIEASQGFCISFLRSVYYSRGMGDGWPCLCGGWLPQEW